MKPRHLRLVVSNAAPCRETPCADFEFLAFCLGENYRCEDEGIDYLTQQQLRALFYARKEVA
jgi:hypothetical protein